MPSASHNCGFIRTGLTAAVLVALTATARAHEVKPTEAPTEQARTNLTKPVDAEIKLTRLRELNITLPNGKQSFVSSASGLVHIGRYFHVVSDDELHLASFLVGSEQPGELLRLLPGDLPEAPAARKKNKPDFEALLVLPPDARNLHGTLLALGSGSRSNRRRGVVITLDAGGKALASNPVDLAALFTPLDAKLKETNIEGAAIVGDELLLFQRGNAGAGTNAIVAYPLAVTLRFLADPSVELPAPDIRIVDLGTVKNVPLGFTDAAALPDGRIVFSAAAEDSANAYDDGSLAGAVIGLVDRNGAILSKQPLSPMVKVEGVVARLKGGSISLNLVTDADDPSTPASLYEAVLSGR
ncbi:MAG: DUF6929 family protein [Afipia sp.]